jgi:hypothetical protein
VQFRHRGGTERARDGWEVVRTGGRLLAAFERLAG